MAGIVSAGAYIPYHRLEGGAVRAVWGSGNPKASRPIASFDEDPITMGAEALINADVEFLYDLLVVNGSRVTIHK